MPKEEWGTKRMCPQCGARFYDLQHDPMTCPVCAAEFTADSLIAGRGRTLISEKTAARPGADADEEVIDAEDDLDADAAEGELDDDLLDDDDDDGDVSLDEIADVEADEEEG